MDKSRVESTIFFIEKISFSLKLFSGHFYGQSFIVTVRGPFALYEETGTYNILTHTKSNEKVFLKTCIILHIFSYTAISMNN